MNFSKARNVELSMVKYIDTQVTASWTKVKVVKSFLEGYEYPAPVVAVYLLSTDSTRKEIGNNNLQQDFTFVIDIFASSDGQRIDLADFIVNLIKDGCPYYIISKESGNPEGITYTQDGRITFRRFVSDSKVSFGDDTDIMDKFRHSITFTVSKYD
jgi:hypothetical protein